MLNYSIWSLNPTSSSICKWINEMCCKRQWLYRPTLLIRSLNLNKYDIKCFNNLMILSIYKEKVDNLDMKYMVNNLPFFTVYNSHSPLHIWAVKGGCGLYTMADYTRWNTVINNGDVKLENIQRWGNQRLTYVFKWPFRWYIIRIISNTFTKFVPFAWSGINEWTLKERV